MAKKSINYLTAIIAAALILSVSKSQFNLKKQQLTRERADLPAKAVVTRVIDGDTIEVDKDHMRVRYIGVDTPETKHPVKGAEFLGKEASDFNKDLTLGQEVFLKYDKRKFDKYGRALAYVWVAGDFVNARLIEEGYARVLTVPPNVSYASLFEGLERKAKSARKGLWNR